MCVEKAKCRHIYKKNFKKYSEFICFGFTQLAEAREPVICKNSESAGAKCGRRGAVESTEAGEYPSTHTKTIHSRHTHKAYSNLMITKEGMCD